MRLRQFDGDGRRALQAHDGRVAVERRLEVDHLVARVHERADRRIEPLARARHDRHFARGIVVRVVERRVLDGKRFTQREHARHRRVLVVARAHGGGHVVDQLRVGREIRRALREIQGVVFGGKLADDGEDRGAHIGQLRAGGGGAVHRPETGEKRLFGLKGRAVAIEFFSCAPCVRLMGGVCRARVGAGGRLQACEFAAPCARSRSIHALNSWIFGCCAAKSG
jgi:hypothetical protein